MEQIWTVNCNLGLGQVSGTSNWWWFEVVAVHGINGDVAAEYIWNQLMVHILGCSCDVTVVVVVAANNIASTDVSQERECQNGFWLWM